MACHTVVVYVHGLWLRGQEAVLLRRRLAASLNADTRSFAYASVGTAVAANAAALRGYLGGIRADTLHLVGHSLGGVIILKCLGSADPTLSGSQAADAALPPGRIVLLGSPLQGSLTAQRLARLPFGRRLLGLACDALISGDERRWDGAREVGIIAGDQSLGGGRLLGSFDGPNDGTVRVEETRLPGATASLVLRVSHTGLPWSREVAHQTAAFLRVGRFERAR